MAFAQGHFPNPVLAVLGAACWVWFVRNSNGWVGFFLTVVGNVIAWEISYRGMIPMPLFARFGVEIGISLALAIVFLTDRFVYKRTSSGLGWLVASAVFPCGWVTLDYLNTVFSPTSSWSSIAYSSVGNGSLDQVASLVGWTGLTFLTGWWAVLLANTFSTKPSIKAKSAMGSAGILVLIFVCVFGHLRTVENESDSLNSLQASLIVGPSTYKTDKYLDQVWEYTRGFEQTSERKNQAIAQIKKSKDDFFNLVREEARQGSKLIIWAEANPTISGAEESEWIAEAKSIATEFNVYVGVSLMAFYPQNQTDQPFKSENKLVLIAPNGEVGAHFLKRTLVPGSSHEIGEGDLPLIKTNFGTWTTAICFDMDFPHVIRPSASQADLILAPSNDWHEVAEIHSRMARLRSIENGCFMVRPTKDGISSVTNACGQLIASQKTNRTEQSILRASITPHRKSTFYSLIGDLFSWVCIFSWILLIVVRVRK